MITNITIITFQNQSTVNFSATTSMILAYQTLIYAMVTETAQMAEMKKTTYAVSKSSTFIIYYYDTKFQQSHFS